MKKTYIAPKTKEYAVNTRNGILLNGSNGMGDTNILVKGQNDGELENESVSIWDLY